MSECLHGMEPTWCAICLRQDEPVKAVVTGAVILANFAGHCICCKEPYPAGTKIGYSREINGWIVVDHEALP